MTGSLLPGVNDVFFRSHVYILRFLWRFSLLLEEFVSTAALGRV